MSPERKSSGPDAGQAPLPPSSDSDGAGTAERRWRRESDDHSPAGRKGEFEDLSSPAPPPRQGAFSSGESPFRLRSESSDDERYAVTATTDSREEEIRIHRLRERAMASDAS
jgi:hypothetical protein